jgi:hypothetical protein
MTNDLRDERLARLLDAAASRIEVTPHVQPVVQRGSLRRGARTTAMVAAVAVFIGAVGYGALRARDASTPALDPSMWNVYPSPEGWTARYPDGWYVREFSGPVGHISLSGAFFSNVAYDFHHPDLGPNEVTSAWDLSSFPRDGVAVEFERFEGGPASIQLGPDTPFPLSLADTSAVHNSSTPEWGGQRIIAIVHDGSSYTLNVWFGPDASQKDRDIARLLVSTVDFPGAPVEPKRSSSSTVTIARYFFSASGLRGVLEVGSSPPSICYSTQSYPARPISIISEPSSGVPAHVEVSYAPRNNDFCDSTVRPALAAGLLADPSAYLVRWRPRHDGPTMLSSFTVE